MSADAAHAAQFDATCAAEQLAAQHLFASLLGATPEQIVDALTVCRPDDVRLLDTPTADALDVALDLAKAGRKPSADVLNAELLRRGLYEGRRGALVQDRLWQAMDGRVDVNPWLLPERAANVLDLVWRAKMTAFGQALIAGASTAAATDLRQLLTREFSNLRDLAERRRRVGGEPA